MTLPGGSNSGIQNLNSTVHGPQAVGDHARAVSHGVPAPVPGGEPSGESAARAELARAVQELRAELTRLRGEQPGALAEEDAEDAARALDEAEAEAASPQPRPGRLRRCVSALTDALDGIARLAGAVGAVEVAAEPVIRALGG
jgi:hypothetical protein